MSAYGALAGRIEKALADVERVVARAEMLAARARDTGDDGYLDGVALNLHGFYAGVERIFEDIARTLDGHVPTGGDWHGRLLLQMAAEMPNTRPAVIADATFQCLDEYRAFRHLVRNVYTFNLRPERVLELVATVRACYEALYQDIARFLQFLQQADAG